MDDEIVLKEGTSLLSVFISSLVVSLIVILGTYFLLDFEVAALVGLCLIIATITTIGVGIENTLINEVRNQLVRLRSQVQGYLTDMYAEMISDNDLKKKA